MLASRKAYREWILYEWLSVIIYPEHCTIRTLVWLDITSRKQYDYLNESRAIGIKNEKKECNITQKLEWV